MRFPPHALTLCSLLLCVMGCDDGSKPDRSDSDVEPAPDAGDSPEPDAQSGQDGLCTRCGGCEETVKVSSMLHKPEPIEYTDLPPAGGDHAVCWTKFGVHKDEAPDERWVHNLEHGAVVFLHNCPDGCASELSRLGALINGRTFALVMPYAALRTRFAAVAWGKRLLSECFDEAAFVQFYEDNADKAVESSAAGPPSGC